MELPKNSESNQREYPKKLDVNQYLYNKFNIEIYNELTSDDSGWNGLFEPLEFFNLLYAEQDYFVWNFREYLKIKEHFNVLAQHFEQQKIEKAYYFFWALDEVIEEHFSDTDYYEFDMELGEQAHKHIKQLYEKYQEKYNSHIGYTDLSAQNLESLKKNVAEYSTTSEKLKYLIDLKTFLYQNDTKNEVGNIEFDKMIRNIELEIEKYYALLDIEQKSSNEKIATASPTKQLSAFSNSELVLLFYYFFAENGLTIRESIDIAPIAKFIHLITGKKFTVTTSSDIYKKLKKAPNFKTDKELIKDLEKVKKQFEDFQLNNIAQSMEKEIEICKAERRKTKYP